MTDQELRKLKRDELLQIMIAQSKRIAVLKKRLDDAEKKLASKELALRETGNIAEASLKINKIFEDAQAAADQYLYNIKLMAQRELKRQGLLRGKHAAPPEEDQGLTDQPAEGYGTEDPEAGTETAEVEAVGVEAPDEAVEEVAVEETADADESGPEESESEGIADIVEETIAEAAWTDEEYAEAAEAAGDEPEVTEYMDDEPEEDSEEDQEEEESGDSEASEAEESAEEAAEEETEDESAEETADEEETAEKPEDNSSYPSGGRRSVRGDDSYLL